MLRRRAAVRSACGARVIESKPPTSTRRRLLGPDHRRARAPTALIDARQTSLSVIPGTVARHAALQRRAPARVLPVGGLQDVADRDVVGLQPGPLERGAHRVRAEVDRVDLRQRAVEAPDWRSGPARDYDRLVNRHPLKLTQLMLFARRAPIDRTPAEVGLDYEDVAFKAGDGVGLKGWFIPQRQPTPARRSWSIHGWMWNRLGNVARPGAGRRPRRRLPARHQVAARRRLPRAAVRPAPPRRERAPAATCSRSARSRRATSSARSTTCARAPTSTASGSARSASRWAAASRSTARPTASRSRPSWPTSRRPCRSSTATSARDQFGALGKPLPAGVELIYRLWRRPPPSSQYPGNPGQPARRTRSSTTSRAPATGGGRWRTSSRCRRARRTRRPGREVPLDRPLRRLPLRRGAPRRDRGVLHSATFRRRGYLRAQEGVERRRPAAPCAGP